MFAPRLDPTISIEEEKTPNYDAGRFYPVHLGQVLNGRYQIATKLGYGANSTVWLARDRDRWRWSEDKYVAVKVNGTSHASRRVPPENEVDNMNHISRVNPNHRGWHFVRKHSNSFTINGTSGSHMCLVLAALREPLWLYRRRYINNVIPPDTLKILVMLFCNPTEKLLINRPNLKPDNIMVKIEDPAIVDRDVKDEFDNPLPQKYIDGRTIYLSRNNYGPLAKPTGIIQIVDFDFSVRTTPGQIHPGAIQAEIYRAPEVILNAGYTHSADIWSLGVMVIVGLAPRQGTFNPATPDEPDEYDEQTHLGQITSLIGPPPKALLSKGQRTSMFYQNIGAPKDLGRIPTDFTLEKSITCMSEEEKTSFLHFVKRMLTWCLEERSSAKELLDDPWMYEDFPQD
ncbi:Protein kinase domain-containing protein [Fusarium sp. Ph1]|nr:Protein kinase domain-containing protein [Fusarium sp. Ph1]